MGTIVKKRSRYYGRLRSDGAETYTEAHATAAEARTALDKLISGQLDPRFLPTFERYWESLLEPGGVFEHRKGENTCNLYDSMLAHHIRGSELGRSRIDTVRKHQVQRHIDKLYKDLAESTVRRIGSCIHTVLQEAVDSELLHAKLENGIIVPANPADKIKYRAIPDAPSYVLSNEELNDLPALLYEWSPRLSAMFTIMADTGARPGEICGMQVTDIRDGAWTIRRQMGRDCEPIPYTKSKKERRVWLTDDALAAIREQGRRTGYVFQTDKSKPLTPDYLGTQLRRFRKAMQREWDRLAKEADLQPLQVPALTPRNLRKTFVTRGMELGDLKSVQAAVGHASAQTTADVYAKARQNPQRELIERMQGSLTARFRNIGGTDKGNGEENASTREAG